MKDLKVSEMMAMQTALWAVHSDSWSPMEPKYGRDFILWMIEEIGEAASIIKKKGDHAIMSDQDVRHAFIEEMGDVLMYYFDALLRYGITAHELSAAYCEKHDRNMGRNYEDEYAKL